jgi:hypothetical protein
MTSVAETEEAGPEASPNQNDELVRHDHDHSVLDVTPDPVINGSDNLLIIAKYTDDLDEADHVADQHSMAAAAAITRLYESGEWADEWLAKEPIKKSYDSRGRPVDPKSKQRFGQWLRWRLEQDGRHSLSTSQTNRLMLAAKTRGNIDAPGVINTVTSEKTLRPLNWLTDNKYQDRTSEVWARAVDLAGGLPADVTSAHTRQAVAEFKKKISPKGVRQVVRTKKAKHDRGVAEAAVRQLFSGGDQDQCRQFDVWYKKFHRGDGDA